MTTRWVKLHEISDEQPIFAGTVVRIYDVGLNAVCKDTDYYDYMICDIYANGDYLQLSCLGQGEGGNIVCVLAVEPGSRNSTGRELKRMLSGPQPVLVNFDPVCMVA